MKKIRRIFDTMMCFVLVAILFTMVLSTNVVADDACGTDKGEQPDEVMESDYQIIKDGTFLVRPGDPQYDNGKPMIRIFTTTWCPHCHWIKETFDEVVEEYVQSDQIIAYHWEIDTGDNILTNEVETRVPESELDIFEVFNPKGSVPTFVFGEKYWRVGNGYEHLDDLGAEEYEFRTIIEELISKEDTLEKVAYHPKPGYNNIEIKDVKDFIDSNKEVTILDVRAALDYESGHIVNAISIPIFELEQRINELDDSNPIIVYSKGGVQSEEACRILVQNGFENIHNMVGGIDAWMFAGFEVVSSESQDNYIDNIPEDRDIFQQNVVSSDLTGETGEDDEGGNAAFFLICMIVIFTVTAASAHMAKDGSFQGNTRRRERHGKGKILTVAVCLLMVSTIFPVGIPAGADYNPINPVALHAFVGDPLFDLSTPAAVFFARDPDEKTAMASTTKVMTLHLAVRAMQDGAIGEFDLVTVSSSAVSVPSGSSLMRDINDVPLQAGEVVRFDNLLRGMMYPSGNDAAQVVGEHVAQGYYGSPSLSIFIALMNQRASALGLTNTHYMNAYGGDQTNHHTTARELAELWSVAIEDEEFAEVVGFQGTYSFQTTIPGGGSKTYQWNWGYNYPGWEGAKGGNTVNCDGPNGGCMVMSATRIGRRVVIAFMQGDIWTEEPDMFNFGFFRLFHPLFRGQSDPWGAKLVSQDIECLPGGKAMSAVLPSNGNTRLVLWDVNVDTGSITKLDNSLDRAEGFWKDFEPPGFQRAEERRRGNPNPPRPGPGWSTPPGLGEHPWWSLYRDVRIEAVGNGYVTVAQKGSNAELSLWYYNAQTGFILADGPIDVGPVKAVRLQQVHPNMFLLAKITSNRRLQLESWKIPMRWGSGLVLLDTWLSTTTDYREIDIAGPIGIDIFNNHRAVTAARRGSNQFVHEVWGVDSVTGDITLLGTSVQNRYAQNIRIEAIPVEELNPSELWIPSHYATAYRDSLGVLEMLYHSISTVNLGSPSNPIYPPLERGVTGPTSEELIDFRIAGLGSSGLYIVGKDVNGFEKHLIWESRRGQNQVITPYLISEHTSDPDITTLSMCALETSHAEGDYVLAKTDSSHSLVVRAWRVGSRPY